MVSASFAAFVGPVPSRRGELIITEGSTGMVGTANTLNVMSDLYVYTVQRGQVLHLRPTDFCAALLRDAVPAEIGNNTAWELLLRDPANRSSQIITSGVYAQIRSFQDATLKKFLGISKDIGPDYQLAFRLNGVVTTLANNDLAISVEVEYASLD